MHAHAHINARASMMQSASMACGIDIGIANGADREATVQHLRRENNQLRTELQSLRLEYQKLREVGIMPQP